MEQIIISGISIKDFFEKMEKLFESKSNPRPIEEQNLESKFISRADAAKLLKVSLPTLHEYTKLGWIKRYRIGRRVLYKQCEIEESISITTSIKHKKTSQHGRQE